MTTPPGNFPRGVLKIKSYTGNPPRERKEKKTATGERSINFLCNAKSSPEALQMEPALGYKVRPPKCLESLELLGGRRLRMVHRR